MSLIPTNIPGLSGSELPDGIRNSSPSIFPSPTNPELSQPQRLLEGSSRYETGKFKYPLNLDTEGQHHVIKFNIRETKASKFIFGAQSALAQEAITEGTSITQDAIEQRTEAGMLSERIGDLREAGENLDFKRQTTQLLASIMLPMPHDMQTSYPLEWDVGKNALLKSTFGQLGSTLKDKDATRKDILDVALNVTAEKVSKKVFSEETLRLFRRSSGVAVNPHLEQLFRGVPFRSFNYKFTFMPFSEEETIATTNIIRMFKYHSLPEVLQVNAGRYFKYPNTFEITFLSNGKENEYLNKIGECACINVSVNYTAAGIWTAFRNGAPIQVELQLAFAELEIMTKQRALAGF